MRAVPKSYWFEIAHVPSAVQDSAEGDYWFNRGLPHYLAALLLDNLLLLAEGVDDLATKSWNVLRLAASDELTVHDDAKGKALKWLDACKTFSDRAATRNRNEL